jgi:hypothetical protein
VAAPARDEGDGGGERQAKWAQTGRAKKAEWTRIEEWAGARLL